MDSDTVPSASSLVRLPTSRQNRSDNEQTMTLSFS
jgi:hypothetical protein